MPCCPNCETNLDCRKFQQGIFFYCRQCNGRFVSIPVLKTEKTLRTLINEIWTKGKADTLKQGRKCPHCGRQMSLVDVEIKGMEVSIELCTLCNYIWFDPGEYDVMPKSGPLPAELPIEAKKVVALMEVELLNERFGEQRIQPVPDNGFGVVLAVFGLPVEINDAGMEHHPWVTWATVAICVAIFAITFNSLDYFINTFGFIPAEWHRLFGYTLVTSFFLHADAFHLLGNMYFLFIFGDNVENILGRSKHIFLLIAAHAGGLMLHAFFDPNTTVPCIGASAGISGILTYYALQFPHARIGMLFFYRWFRLPVLFYFALWIFSQTFLVMNQIDGSGSVSGLAHLGGVASGIIAFIFLRTSSKQGIEC